MSRKRVLTPSQVRADFHRRGQTLTAWAAERGYPRQAVYRVLAGQDKATYGRAHEIAVALGMKDPTPEHSADAGYRNTQTRAVA